MESLLCALLCWTCRLCAVDGKDVQRRQSATRLHGPDSFGR